MPNHNIIKAVDSAVNQLVDKFVFNPWHHRVEHSLHCELYGLLRNFPELQEQVSGNNFSTQMVHKEWPEPKSHSKRKRRGNFDLAILKSGSGNWDVHEFRCGKLPILCAFEMGLNYGLDHLYGDVQKLKASNVEFCYLIHFVTPFSRNQKGVKEKIEQLVNAETDDTGLRVAYADIGLSLKRKLGEKIQQITANSA